MLRLLAFAALWVFLFGTALSGGWDVMFKLSYLLLLLFVLSWAWAQAGGRWLAVRREPTMVRAQVGSTLSEQVTITNASWLPRPWLEVRAASTLPEHDAIVATSLGP